MEQKAKRDGGEGRCGFRGMSLSTPSSALLLRSSWGTRCCCWLSLKPVPSPILRSCLRAARPRPRPIVDMSYSRHFLDFQGSSIPSAMKKLVVTKLSSNFREAVTLRRDVPVPLPGDGDLLVRNRWDTPPPPRRRAPPPPRALQFPLSR